MTAKRFNRVGGYVYDGDKCISHFEDVTHRDDIVTLLNELADENEQLKQDRFICLDCKHSGYTEIGCLCEKEDHWSDYKTECEDYEGLE